MIEATCGSKTFRVVWMHKMRPEDKKKCTICVIHDVSIPDTPVDIAIGIAILYEGDKFSRAVGRKISLEKAFQNTWLYHLNKEERRAIWEQVMMETSGTWGKGGTLL